MLGIDTGTIPTQMVDLEFNRNRPYEIFVSNTMSLLGSTIELEDAVAIPISTREPEPTSIGLLDLVPEALLDGHATRFCHLYR